MSAPQIPLPTLDGLNGEFHRHCANGELRFQRCNACETFQHPPRMQCPHCGARDWSWARASGRGRIFSWTVTHQAFHPAFADQLPYAVVITELEEGVRLVSGLRGLAPDELALDLPVEVVLERIDDEVALPYVRPLRP